MITLKLNNSSLHFIVDEIDKELATKYKWKKFGNYVAVKIGGINFLLHRLITGAKKGQQVHHKDGNPLNNCRANLVIMSATEHQNTKGPHKDSLSKYKGVAWQHSGRKWKAEIYIKW